MDEDTIILIAVGAGVLLLALPKVTKTLGHALNTSATLLDGGLSAIDYVVAGPQYPANENYSKPNLFNFDSWAVNQPNYLDGFLGFK